MYPGWNTRTLRKNIRRKRRQKNTDVIEPEVLEPEVLEPEVLTRKQLKSSDVINYLQIF
jgi:hypothetical protein